MRRRSCLLVLHVSPSYLWTCGLLCSHLVACGQGVAVGGVPGRRKGVVQVSLQAVHMVAGAQVHDEGVCVVPHHHHQRAAALAGVCYRQIYRPLKPKGAAPAHTHPLITGSMVPARTLVWKAAHRVTCFENRDTFWKMSLHIKAMGEKHVLFMTMRPQEQAKKPAIKWAALVLRWESVHYHFSWKVSVLKQRTKLSLLEVRRSNEPAASAKIVKPITAVQFREPLADRYRTPTYPKSFQRCLCRS